MVLYIPVYSFGNKVSAASEFLNLDLFIDGIND